MPFPSEIVLGVLALLALLSLALQGEGRRRVRAVLFVFATLVVIGFYVSVATGTTTSSLKGNVAAEKAELPLKMQSTLNVGVARLYEIFTPIQDAGGRVKKPIELSNTGMKSMMKTSYKLLEESLKASPDPLLVKARMIVVAAMSDVAALKNPANLQKLIDDLKSAQKYKQLGETLEAVYINPQTVKPRLADHARTIKTSFATGWYKDNALLSLYKVGNTAEYKKLSDHLQERYFVTFVRCCVAVAVVIAAFFVGFVALIIMIGSLGRRDTRDIALAELPVLQIDLKTVFAVFVAWQATEVALGALLRMIPKGAMSLHKDPVGLAVFVLLTYLVNMVPAVVWLYFLALKPRALPFLTAMKIRWRTQSAGPFKLILTGVLSWCAAVPLVVITCVLVTWLGGSRGSDNPIIGQIISAATTASAPALILLFITVAVLAPIFEEIIFRGFLYASLRNRIGVFPAMLISSLVFAGIHLDPGGMPMLFAIGFILAVCYERSRSLVACMIAHGMWNGGTLLLSLSLMAN